jgi:glycolate oxidase FAD binding subunit
VVTDIARVLRGACGADAVRPADPAEHIVGVKPSWVASPTDTAALAAVLSVATAHGLTAVPRGEGTKLQWGGEPTAVDVIVDMARLTGIHAHYADDLVVTVGAGTPLRAVQAVLAASGQRLAIDAGSRDATIGGLLATGEAGPLRLRNGSPRDLLLGAEFVRSDGTISHSGGRVVKNVAGYDLGKLLCGSFGTLAVFATATLRLQPLPATATWITRSVHTPLEVNDLVDEVLASTLDPTAIEMDLPGYAAGALCILLEGSIPGVAARTRDAIRLLGHDATATSDAPAWWGSYPFGPGEVALKIAAPVADLHSAIYTLRDAVGIAVPVRGSAGVGVCYAAPPVEAAVSAINAVRTILMPRGGTCVVLDAPPGVREQVDMWGPVDGIDLMRSVKRRFDPTGVLAPGRFVGGI